MAEMYVGSEVYHEAFFLPICYNNYFCSIKYVQVMQFSMGCCAEGKRGLQQDFRQLPRRDGARRQARGRQNGRSASWPAGVPQARRQSGRY
jgi:hypothetical protein